jgi:hypothetical protein
MSNTHENLTSDFANDTLIIRIPQKGSQNIEHLSDYKGKYALICLSNDHERCIGGVIENIAYDELFEQPTITFRILYGGVDTIKIPRSSILWMNAQIFSEEELKLKIEQSLSFNILRKGSMYFTSYGNILVFNEMGRLLLYKKVPIFLNYTEQFGEILRDIFKITYELQESMEYLQQKYDNKDISRLIDTVGYTFHRLSLSYDNENKSYLEFTMKLINDFVFSLIHSR